MIVLVGRKARLSLWWRMCSWIGVGLWLPECFHQWGIHVLDVWNGSLCFPLHDHQIYRGSYCLQPCNHKSGIWWYRYHTEAPRLNLFCSYWSSSGSCLNLLMGNQQLVILIISYFYKVSLVLVSSKDSWRKCPNPSANSLASCVEMQVFSVVSEECFLGSIL